MTHAHLSDEALFQKLVHNIRDEADGIYFEERSSIERLQKISQNVALKRRHLTTVRLPEF